MKLLQESTRRLSRLTFSSWGLTNSTSPFACLLRCEEDPVWKTIKFKYHQEVKKPNGDQYAADSIFYLVLGIQEYLFEVSIIEQWYNFASWCTISRDRGDVLFDWVIVHHSLIWPEWADRQYLHGHVLRPLHIGASWSCQGLQASCELFHSKHSKLSKHT